jgi:hypothetical protein
LAVTDKHPTPEEMDEPVSADPLSFEQIVESLLAVPPLEDDDYAAKRRPAD